MSYISRFIDISDEDISSANSIVHEVLREVVSSINLFCKNNKINNYGIYSTGSISAEDMVVDKNLEFLSDLDIHIISASYTCYEMLKKHQCDIESACENSFIKIDLSIKSIEDCHKASCDSLVAPYRYKFQGGTKQPLKISKPLQCATHLIYVLKILPSVDISSMEIQYNSNIKFLKRTIEFLNMSLWCDNLPFETYLNLDVFSSNHLKLIKYFLKKQGEVEKTPGCVQELYEFNILLLQSRVLAKFEKKDKKYLITDNVKKNFIYNFYTKLLLTDKEESLLLVESLKSKYKALVCFIDLDSSTSIDESISIVSANFCEIERNATIISRLQFEFKGGTITISLNCYFRYTETLQSLLQNYPKSIVNIKVFYDSAMDLILYPPFLQVLSISKAYLIPLYLSGDSFPELPESVKHDFLIN